MTARSRPRMTWPHLPQHTYAVFVQFVRETNQRPLLAGLYETKAKAQKARRDFFKGSTLDGHVKAIVVRYTRD